MVARPRHQSSRTSRRNTSRTSTASRSSTSKTVDVILKDPNEPMLTVARGAGIRRARSQASRRARRRRLEGREDEGQGDRLAERELGRRRRLSARRAGSATSRSSSCATSITGAASRPFERVVIRHMGDSAAQLLAMRRGDIDAAFNLIPEQVATLKGDANVRLEQLASLDFVYMALTQEPEFNKALAVKEARQAIGYAIDYDGIKNAHARRRGPAAGALPADRHQRLDRGDREADRLPPGPREGEGAAGQGRLSPTASSSRSTTATPPSPACPTSSWRRRSSPTSAASASRRSSRRWTRSTCAPSSPLASRQGGVLTFWNPPAVENSLWALAAVERVAKRVHWTPPEDLVKLVSPGGGRERPEEAGRALGRVPEAHGRPGEPLHPVPADLPDRRPQQPRQGAGHRGRLAHGHERGDAKGVRLRGGFHAAVSHPVARRAHAAVRCQVKCSARGAVMRTAARMLYVDLSRPRGHCHPTLTTLVSSSIVTDRATTASS